MDNVPTADLANAEQDSQTAIMPAPISEITESEFGDSDVTNASTQKPSLETITAEIHIYLHIANQSIIEVGKRLIQAKEMLPHGEWQNWLKINFNLSIPTAQKYMQVYNRFGISRIDTAFGSTQLIALLALPEGEEEKFIADKAAEGNPVDAMTVKKLRDEIKKYKADLAATVKERDELKDTKQILYRQVTDNDDRLFQANQQLISQQNKQAELQKRILQLEGQLAQKPLEVFPEDYELLKKENAALRDRPIEVATELPADYESTKLELATLKEREESFKRDFAISQSLAHFLGELPALLNAINLQNSVALLAENNLQSFETQLAQLHSLHSELQNYLDSWKKSFANTFPTDRADIIAELEHLMLQDTTKQTSDYLWEVVTGWGFQSLAQLPDDKLSDLLILARDFQKSLSQSANP